jgi:hypothetical protein
LAILHLALWWWWKARPFDSITETTTMLIIGIILSFVVLGFLCWLLFTLAIYALPFFAGVTAGLAALHNGSGPIAAILVGLIAGVVTLVVGQIAFATVRSPLVRAAIALLFAAPAAVAGYHATLGLAHIGVPSAGWQHAFAFVGAVIVGCTAWARMTVMAAPVVRPAAAAGPARLPPPSATWNQL